MIVEEVRLQLGREQARQKKYADRKRRDVRYEAGDSVLVSTKNMRTLQGKLTPKWVGPYLVREVRANGRSVELDLRGELGKAHPTFHVSLVKPYLESQLEWPGRDTHSRPAPQLVDGETEWEVESIVGKQVMMERRQVAVEEPPKRAGLRSTDKPPPVRKVKKLVPVVYYLVKWKGYGDDASTWMEEARLSNSREAVDEYELLVRQRDGEATASGAAAAVEVGRGHGYALAAAGQADDSAAW